MQGEGRFVPSLVLFGEGGYRPNLALLLRLCLLNLWRLPAPLFSVGHFRQAGGRVLAGSLSDDSGGQRYSPCHRQHPSEPVSVANAPVLLGLAGCELNRALALESGVGCTGAEGLGLTGSGAETLTGHLAVGVVRLLMD